MNRPRLAFPLIAAVFGLALVACSSSDGGRSFLAPGSATPPVPPFPGDTWQLSYNVSGGIDGRSYSLTLTSDGAAHLQDKRNKVDVTRTIDAAEVRKVAGYLATAALTTPQLTPRGGCADCIDITLTVTSAGRTYTLTTNEVNKQPRLTPLLVELANLYKANQ